jgi:hypothetical protein
MCISFIHKIWAGPEILDQVYFIHTENLGWSRNSGPGVFHSYTKSEMVQKFWTRCISFTQKIWAGPEILDHVLFIHTENLGWSRNSGPCAFHSHRKSALIQKFWTRCIAFRHKIWAGPEILVQVFFIHSRDLGWSRNSGPCVFHSYTKSEMVQKFWTRCISFIHKIWAGPEILDQV